MELAMKKSIYLIIIAFTVKLCLFGDNFIYNILEEDKPLAFSTVANLRLRTKPGTNYKIIGKLNYNEPVLIIQRDSRKRVINGRANYWYRVKRANGTVGWSYGSYLKIYPLKDWNYLMFSRDYIFKQEGDNQQDPSYNFVKADTNVFMIVPASWRLDYSIFYDEDDKKCGELTPDGIIQSEMERICYSSSKATPIEENSLDISRYRIKRQVSEGYHEDGTGVSGRWFSHNFCINRDNYHLGLVFYTKQKDQNKELFENIVRTVSFTVELK